jgi:hypothetical protein
MAAAAAPLPSDDLWSALQEFIGDTKLHGSKPTALEVPMLAAPAADAITALLARFPIAALFTALEVATIAGDNGHVRAFRKRKVQIDGRQSRRPAPLLGHDCRRCIQPFQPRPVYSHRSSSSSPP